MKTTATRAAGRVSATPDARSTIAAKPPRTPAAAPRLAARRVAAVSLTLALLVSLGVALYGDVREVGGAFHAFRVGWLAPAIVLGFAAHAIRWARWHWFLRRVTRDEDATLSYARSIEVYAAGVAMQVTPGRVGEWVKSYYVRALGGPPEPRTAPIVLAERVTDMLGLVLLSAAGLFVYRTAFAVVAASAALAFAILFSLTHAPASRLVAGLLARLPLARRLVPRVDEFYAAAAGLLTLRSVPAATLVAFGSWVAEALAYWCVLRGVGVEPSTTLLLQAVFIWPVAMLAGGLLLTPAGLGVAEGGLTALAVTLVAGLARGPAAAAALISRVVTLWLGTAIGLVTMLRLARRLGAER